MVADDLVTVLDREAEKPCEGYELPAGEWRPHTVELVTSFWHRR